MAKTHTRYVCQECGRVAASYMGKCPQCGSFNSMVEEVIHDEPVSKNTAVDAKYDEKQDLARASMATGQLSSPADRLAVYFGHTGPKKCEINIDFGKTRGWVEFREK